MANDRPQAETAEPKIITEQVGIMPTTVDLGQVQGGVTLELGKTTRLVLAATDALPETIKNKIGGKPYVLYVDQSSTNPAGTHNLDLRYFPIAEDRNVDLGPEEDTGRTFGFAPDVAPRHARIKIVGGILTVVNYGPSGSTAVSWQEK